MGPQPRPDPIRALIKKHRKAYAAQHDAYTEDPAFQKKLDALYNAEERALVKLLTTRPTTLQGVIALLNYIADRGGADDMHL